MKTFAYVIYDVKAMVYNKPFFMINDSIAKRAFTDLANDMNTDIGKHPEDYSLWNIGEYDDIDATFKLHKHSQPLGKAMEFVELTVQQKADENQVLTATTGEPN